MFGKKMKLSLRSTGLAQVFLKNCWLYIGKVKLKIKLETNWNYYIWAFFPLLSILTFQNERPWGKHKAYGELKIRINNNTQRLEKKWSARSLELPFICPDVTLSFTMPIKVKRCFQAETHTFDHGQSEYEKKIWEKWLERWM